MLYTLAASLGSSTITMGNLMAFISTLTASSGTFMASTTLTRPLQTLSRLCNSLKAYRVALSRAIQALPQPLQHFYGLYMQSHDSVVRSCQQFLKKYIFTAHKVQKSFLKAMIGLLEAMRVLLEAVIVLLEAVSVLVEAIRVLV